jgi:small subunit ribosomal protein S8
MTDPIADMLSRIRNAQAVRKPEVLLPFSKLKFALAEILKREGYIKDLEKVAGSGDRGQFDQIRIVLKYLGPKEPAISTIRRVSTPGRRVYTAKGALPVVLNNLGIAVISTSNGLMTNREAQKAGLGGEVICEIY